MFNRRLLVDSVGGTGTPTDSVTIASGVGSVTIPKGVNVVMLEMYWISSGKMYDFSYVGVTPGKTYKLKGVEEEYNYGEGWIYETYNTSNYKDWYYNQNGFLDMLTASNYMRLVISWSPTINEKSPDYTDY